MAIPWSLIIDIFAKLLDLFLTNQETRNRLKMQMYEFARRFDIDAVDGNAKYREEYKKLKEELAKKEKERQDGGG